MLIDQSNFNTKTNQASILNSTRDIQVSICLHFCFCSLTNRRTDYLIIEQMLIDQKNLYKKESYTYLKKQPRYSVFISKIPEKNGRFGDLSRQTDLLRLCIKEQWTKLHSYHKIIHTNIQLLLRNSIVINQVVLYVVKNIAARCLNLKF